MIPLLANLLDEPRMGWLEIAVISGSVSSFLIIVGMAIWYWRKRKSD
jgi:hypothetical protein